MDNKIDDEARNRRLDELSMLSFELDDICHEIWFTLMAYKRLRFNDLYRYLKKFGTDISKPTLIDHLNHLKKLKVITRKREDAQGVSYGLTDEITELLHTSPEDLDAWLERFDSIKGLPEKLRLIKIDKGELLNKLTDKELDDLTDKALRDTLALNLFELKSFVNYDIKLKRNESDAVFWKFVGNPMYRLHERTVADDCRDSERYRKSLFEKMDLLIEELRSDKELLRERRARQSAKIKTGNERID